MKTIYRIIFRVLLVFLLLITTISTVENLIKSWPNVFLYKKILVLSSNIDGNKNYFNIIDSRSSGLEIKSDLLDGCRALWIIKLLPIIDLQNYQRTFEQAKNCQRRELQIAFLGAVAWAKGDLGNFSDIWSQLPVSYIIRRGEYLVKNGENEQGRELLLLAQSRRGEIKSPDTKISLFIALAQSYQEGGQPSKAKEYYEYAWKLTPNDSKLAYVLSRLYMESNEYDQAVILLENGVNNLPVRTPLFSSSYYIELSKAYFYIGNNEKARESLETAWNLLEKDQNLISQDYYLQQEQRLYNTCKIISQCQE